MYIDFTFSNLQPAVEYILQRFDITQTTNFVEVVRDELADVSLVSRLGLPDEKQLRDLYELRSQYLDWELGTGYLGFFSEHAGTRYTFTRRMEVLGQIFPEVDAGFNILEIGCGAGLLCLKLSQMAKTVVGVDISFFVLDFANKVKEYLRCNNVLFQCGDAENLAFQDETFDIVICSEVLEHLISPQNALTEMHRVTKKNGRVILTTPCAVSLSDLSISIFRVFNKHIEAAKNVHFDKKTYLAIQRSTDKHHDQLYEKSAMLQNRTFIRIHERFRYSELIMMFHTTGFKVEHTSGAIFAFPPHYQVFYRYCPAMGIPIIRGLERLLNRLRLFQRFGAVTTCFRLKPIT